jgi:membrane fusion protein (multidrug efflux system)
MCSWSHFNLALADWHGALLSLAIAALVLLGGCEKPQAQLPPPNVQVLEVIKADVPIVNQWIGTSDGFVNAEIRARVEGYLLTQNYREGEVIKTGDLMFTIDPRPFEAQLAQARAELLSSEADLGKAELAVTRNAEMLKSAAVSQKEYDNSVQNLKAARAQVAAQQAQVQEAELNLGYCQIYAPIDGVAGIAKAQIGDLVGTAGAQPLTTVSNLNPIKVYFPISETDYLKAASRINKAERDPNKYEGLQLNLTLTDGKVYPHTGQFYLAGREVDPKTGTIMLAATFPNDKNVLRPGQFALVSGTVDKIEGALIVPQRAINELQGGYQIALVQEGKASIKKVQVGPRYGQYWVITEGLKEGDTVIVEGFQRVKDGTEVKAQPYQAPPLPAQTGVKSSEPAVTPASGAGNEPKPGPAPSPSGGT